MRNRELEREHCHSYDRDSFCLTFLSSQRETEKQIDRGKQIDQQTERQTDRQREKQRVTQGALSSLSKDLTG